MKYFIALLVSLIVLSCSNDEVDQTAISNEFIPIEEVFIPSEFQLNQNHQITITYTEPTTCHKFSNLLFEKDIDENSRRAVAIATKSVTEGVPCDSINKTSETTFNLFASQRDYYLFRFWQGKDDDGKDVYLEIEVPVVN